MEKKEWKITYFDFSKDDLDDLLSLFKEQYGSVDPSNPEYFKWYCLENPAGKALIPIVIDPETTKIIGEWWGIPTQTKYPNGEMLGSVGMNVVIARKYRGMKVIDVLAVPLLEQNTERGINFSINFPNKRMAKVFKLVPSLKDWFSVGMLGMYALPLDPAILDNTRMSKNPIILSVVKIIASLIFPILFFHRKTNKVGKNIQILEISTFDEKFDQFWKKVKDKYPFWFKRDASFLTWRYKENPLRKYAALVAMENDEMIGYIILRTGMIKKFSLGAIVDLVVEPTARGDLAAQKLVHEAILRFRKEKLSVSVFINRPGTQEEKAIKHQGYRLLPGALSPEQVEMYIRFFPNAIPIDLMKDINNWYITLGDFDIV